MNKIKKINYILLSFFTISIFLIFAYIAYITPYAGDDWGYAFNNGYFNKLWYLYTTWSGRVLAELWVMWSASNKIHFIISNALIFSSSYLFANLIFYKENRFIKNSFIFLALIFSVSVQLRMETYSWSTGSTYSAALSFALAYIYLNIRLMFKDKGLDYKVITMMVLGSLSALCAGLFNEGISAALAISSIFVAIYAYYYKRRYFIYFLIAMFCSILALLIMRLSPGATLRFNRDHLEWASKGILYQITFNYSNLVYYTFHSSKFLVIFLSSTLILLLVEKYKQLNKSFLIYNLAYLILSFPLIIANRLPKNLELALDHNSIFGKIYWTIYAINLLVIIFFALKKSLKRDVILYLTLLALGANTVMLISPIFGARSSLYTYYFLSISIILILNELEKLHPIIDKTIFIGSIILFAIKLKYYHYIFKIVENENRIREAAIEYYRTNPKEKEAWFKKYPPGTLHGIDIEPDDHYHFEVFKRYFNLPQEKIYFYVE